MNEPPRLPPPLPTFASPPKKSGLAIWSLVLGILSLFCLSILAGIPAAICGHVALSRIKRSGGVLRGTGFAIGGLVAGYLSIALFPFIVGTVIPNLRNTRNEGLTELCIDNLRQIHQAKETWAIENRKSDSQTPTGQDLEPYLKQGLNTLVCPAGGQYSINSVGQKPTCSIPGHDLPNN